MTDDPRDLFQGFDDEETGPEDLYDYADAVEAPRRSAVVRKRRRGWGLTPFQWFVLSLLLFLSVCLLSFFFLLLTNRIVLPL